MLMGACGLGLRVWALGDGWGLTWTWGFGLQGVPNARPCEERDKKMERETWGSKAYTGRGLRLRLRIWGGEREMERVRETKRAPDSCSGVVEAFLDGNSGGTPFMPESLSPTPRLVAPMLKRTRSQQTWSVFSNFACQFGPSALPGTRLLLASAGGRRSKPKIVRRCYYGSGFWGFVGLGLWASGLGLRV